MSIHSDHPFLEPPSERSPLRRLRGRMPAPVTVWATGLGSQRAGLTVSSMLVADGDPGEVLGLIDGDSELADALDSADAVAISLLGQRHRQLADVFAGQAPSPGGMFRTGSWADSGWGPVLIDCPAWIGVRLSEDPDLGQDLKQGRVQEHAGWALLVRGRIEHVEVTDVAAPESDPLISLRGRYRRAGD